MAFVFDTEEKIGLDKYCNRILILMLIRMVYKNQPARFNKLYGFVKSFSGLRKMSKPTFNAHLRHLIEEGYVKSESKGKQHVIYFLDDDMAQISEAKETVSLITDVQKERSEKFKTFSLEQKAQFVTDFATLIELWQAYMLIQDIIEPKNRFDHFVAFGLAQAYLNSLFLQLYEDSSKNTEKAHCFKELLEKAIKSKENDLTKLTGIKP